MKDTTLNALIAYRDLHRPVGHFLRNVLENSLLGAYFHADEQNTRDMHEIVSWVYNEMPGHAWGNPQKVKDWLTPAVPA